MNVKATYSQIRHVELLVSEELSGLMGMHLTSNLFIGETAGTVERL